MRLREPLVTDPTPSVAVVTHGTPARDIGIPIAADVSQKIDKKITQLLFTLAPKEQLSY